MMSYGEPIREYGCGSRPVKKDELVICARAKCRKVIRAGRLVYDNGLCHNCEVKRCGRVWHVERGRFSRLDREFRMVISNE